MTKLETLQSRLQRAYMLSTELEERIKDEKDRLAMKAKITKNGKTVTITYKNPITYKNRTIKCVRSKFSIRYDIFEDRKLLISQFPYSIKEIAVKLVLGYI